MLWKCSSVEASSPGGTSHEVELCGVARSLVKAACLPPTTLLYPAFSFLGYLLLSYAGAAGKLSKREAMIPRSKSSAITVGLRRRRCRCGSYSGGPFDCRER